VRSGAPVADPRKQKLTESPQKVVETAFAGRVPADRW